MRATLVIVAAWLACLGATPFSLAVDASNLAIVINTDDPLSEAIGAHYAAARKIPTRNVVHVRVGKPRETISPTEFTIILAAVREKAPRTIEAYALAWTLPYRVGCMSITSAFAFGYGTRFCADGCKPTAPNPYFDSPSRLPYTDHHLRPAVLLAASTVANAKALIVRGVRSDGQNPRGRAYLVVTKDTARSSRAPYFPATKALFGTRYETTIVHTDGLREVSDIMFYFTGATHVPYLDSLGFLPGAVADHLTSTGGQLNKSAQMSALRWLEAGATGSYGTVVEPCNFPQKFPQPALVMKYYLAGDTLLEAYWKSVVWPGQGVFIGEPLARPFAPALPRRQ